MDRLNHLSDGEVVAVVIFITLLISVALWWFSERNKPDGYR
jgi:hypothetical protein